LKTEDNKVIPASGYKAITREDTGNLIAIQKDSYKVVSNVEVIKPLMDQLNNLDTHWAIDPSHSFVTDQRMRLQIRFDDLTLNDGRSDIALSLFLHNSYDSSEGVRMFWGAIRFICSNGMVFGKILGKYYKKHTQNINLNNLKEQVEQTYDSIPVIKNRIDILQNLSVGKSLMDKVEETMGKRIMKYVKEQPKPAHQWALYNYLTWYASHVIDKRLRAAYQVQISKTFQL
jgi:hypothetical protein